MQLDDLTIKETSPEEFELDLKVNWHRNVAKDLFVTRFATPKKIHTFQLHFLRKSDYDDYVRLCFLKKGQTVTAVGELYTVTGFIRSEPPNIQWSGLNSYTCSLLIEEV